MSWIKRRPLAALAALALALRVAAAVATERAPIFPAYYYTDANLVHAAAVSALGDVESGREPRISGALSERIQIALTLRVYRAFGPRPLAIKLLNALMGAIGVAALAWALSLAFPLPAALAAGLLVAVWPSHVFYTSQNLKEAPADLLAYLALAAGLAAAGPSAGSKARFGACAALTACLLGSGFYRSATLLGLSAGLLLACALAAFDRASRPRALLAAAAVLAALAAYPRVSQRLYLSFETTLPDEAKIIRSLADQQLIPRTYDALGSQTVSRPTSPEGITAARRHRQLADRRWTHVTTGREIGTQIYPDEEFKTWGSVLAYIPKGAFAVLFMPLPGLYPMDGKLGRYAAAAENVVLLALAALAAAGLVRGPRTPSRLGLLAFFAAMTAGAALLEYDLGSAGRHKLLYLPMLFPFAAEEILRLTAPKERA